MKLLNSNTEMAFYKKHQATLIKRLQEGHFYSCVGKKKHKLVNVCLFMCIPATGLCSLALGEAACYICRVR